MKKILKNQIVAIGLAAVVAAAGTLLTGCGAKPSGEEHEFVEKNYTAPAEDVNTLTIDVKNRKIELLPSENGQICITYYESDKEFYELNRTEEKELRMTYAENKQWGDYVGRKTAPENRTVRIELPQSALHSLTLNTTNADISLPPLSVLNSVTVSVNNGNIALENLNPGNSVTLNAKNGNISGTIAGTMDEFAIHTQVKKGESNLPPEKETGTKTLLASANNGNIQLNFLGQNE
ncbi:DUF4097 family beta strand repeat-containing protein [Congzhengia minquanensis]|uniref:DUF4097 family beta strand repeat protein n=1 Tax=Congzhengia minquanensis TaxID=2763657 RepID=A0A926DLM3_9FIRM|nr:DUF4097 family beta strand repeat-containing protein [Congzhengia minquanensis]MBC8539979.1 DUF4097 family beta strand repeat protein [Congzhengia minquanensis]